MKETTQLCARHFDIEDIKVCRQSFAEVSKELATLCSFEGCRQLIGDRVLRLAAPTIAFDCHQGWTGGRGLDLFSSQIMILYSPYSFTLFSFTSCTPFPSAYRSPALNINIHSRYILELPSFFLPRSPRISFFCGLRRFVLQLIISSPLLFQTLVDLTHSLSRSVALSLALLLYAAI